jgi:hypothetical protein
VAEPATNKVIATESDAVPTLDAYGEAQIANDQSQAIACATSSVQSPVLEKPPAIGVAGLPFSWLPISISSVLFGLAHFGYGPEPIPLFFLALVLGYLYYRTHRIVPSIVAHAVFNLFTMIVLWRLALHGHH